MTDPTWPTLAMALDRAPDRRERMDLVRGCLRAAASFADAGDDVPESLLVDLRHVIARDDVGERIVTQACRLLSKLTPVTERN